MLREVSRSGSLTSAAAALSFTTSAVSQQIAKLEHEVGVALLERHPRGVVLTEAGQVSARRDGLLERLHRRDIELTLLWDYPWQQIQDENLTLIKLMNDPTILLVQRDHPIAERKSVRIDTLRDQEWIVRDEHPVADVLRRVCQDAGFEPRIAFAANDYQETQGMVAAGIGIALAPQLAVSALRADVVAVPLANSPTRRILLAHLANRRLSPAAQQAAAVFRATAKRRTPRPAEQDG